MPGAEHFVDLAGWLRGGAAPVPPAAAVASEPEPEPVAVAAPVPVPKAPVGAVEAAREVRLFRARLADALEVATRTLVRDLAYTVLGRELAVAPADVAAIATRLIAEHPAAMPVAIRHAPGEALDVDVPAVADPALASGDVVLVLAGGEVDARLGVRLDVVLEAWA